MPELTPIELFREANRLSLRVDKLFNECDRLQEEARSLKAEHQTYIDELKAKADSLAVEFKKLYQESQGAYAAGSGGLAKALSIEGHQKQDECEALNEQVRGEVEKMQAVVNRLCRQADAKYDEAMACLSEIKRLEAELKRLDPPLWIELREKWSERGYQSDFYIGIKKTKEHLHDYYSIDERGVRSGAVYTDERTKKHTSIPKLRK